MCIVCDMGVLVLIRGQLTGIIFFFHVGLGIKVILRLGGKHLPLLRFLASP